MHTHTNEEDCNLSCVMAPLGAPSPRPFFCSGEISFHAYQDYARGILNKPIYILSNIENSSVIIWLEWPLDHALWGMASLLDRYRRVLYNRVMWHTHDVRFAPRNYILQTS